jgi:hypothetical protein
MRKCVLLAAILAAFTPAMISAQTSKPTPPAKQASPQSPYPEPPRYFVMFHGGAQVGSQDFSRTVDFNLYDEQARFESSQKAKGGFLYDIGGAARVHPKYGIGLSFAAFQSSGDAAFNGSLPHPLEFDRPRNFNGSASLDHKEKAVHIQGLWFIPYTDKIDFTVGVGPSFFSVEQSFVRGIMFSENPPDFTSVTIDEVTVVNVKESGIGFNVGATMSYEIGRHFGTDMVADVIMRYSHGSLTFALGEDQTAHAHAGGFQIGAGIGLRFAGGWPPWR